MIYVYRYSYNSTFPILIGKIKDVNNSNTKKVHIISSSSISIAYLLISVFGFILSKEILTEIFLENDEDNEIFDYLGSILKKPIKYV